MGDTVDKVEPKALSLEQTGAISTIFFFFFFNDLSQFVRYFKEEK